MPIPMTVEGAERLREELQQRKSVLRQEITQAIAEARAHGDLKENAEYHAAREQQSFNEGRIQEIEGKLADAQVIDIAKMPAGEKVIFGATVTLLDVDADQTTTYQIVGEDEADASKGQLSVKSPLGRALIGKEKGEFFVFHSPAGERELEVDDIVFE